MGRCFKAVFLFILLFSVSTAFGQGSSTDGAPASQKPIRGDVFILPDNTVSLPRDFSRLKPIGKIFVSEINVPDRSWTEGFPHVPEIFEWFAIEYTATMVIKEPTEFVFSLGSDDGSRLYIDGKVIVNNDGQHSFKMSWGSATLSKGEHKFRLVYFQGPRAALGLQLFVKKKGSKEAAFPGSDIDLIQEQKL